MSRYAEDVVNCIRFIIFYTMAVSTIVLTLSGIILITVSENNVMHNKYMIN